jgi:hypothetical protein
MAKLSEIPPQFTSKISHRQTGPLALKSANKMKPSQLIILLILCGIAAFAMLQRRPVPAAPQPKTPAAAETLAPKPAINKNRLTGPHDGSHIKQGFACPACAYKPLEY